MPFRFEIFPSKPVSLLSTSRYWWRLVATNGRTMADSGEGYDSEQNARRAIGRIQEEISRATVHMVDR